MTGLDWAIVGFTVLLAAYGYLQGFIVGALSLAGFAAGALIGTRLAPALLPSGAHSPYAPMFGLIGAVLAGGVLASGLEGVGLRLRRRVRLPGLGLADGLLGAGLTACVALGIAWIAGAVLLQAPGAAQWRRTIQRSAVLRELNSILPPSGTLLHALARFDPLPAFRGPQVTALAPPSRRDIRDPGVRRSAASVVKIIGDACGLGIEGSGWVAGPGLVVTNAHVVAGETDTQVQVPGDGTHAATAVHFDPHNDVAVLSVGGLVAAPLAIAPGPPTGTGGAILGYPHNGGLDVEPARVGAAQQVISDDAYGRGPVRRTITPLRGLVRSGNSGGPVVSRGGSVLATVFAATTGGGPPGGYAVPNSIVARALAAARHSGPVSTGACAE